MTQCVRCVVRGRVQGVFFRASTQQEARQLGLTGYARNLSDGSVEVLVCGNPSDVKHLQDWLRQGPTHAQVTGVQCDQVDMSVAELPKGFQTG